LNYEEIDAETFASWGIDYLKLDGCYVYDQPPLDSEETYKKIYGHWHQVLSSMPNPLIFSESAPAYFSGDANLTDWYLVMDWVPSYGELARHSDDIATFDTPEPWKSILTNYGFEVLLARYQSPGYFNDPDFLIVDHANLTMDEKKSHFALWSSFSAPLIISAYIPDLSDEEIAYLTNEDLIAVDQDALGLQATLISQDGTWDVLSKSLDNGDRLLTILNRGGTEASLSVPLERLGYPSLLPQLYIAKDLWTGKTTHISNQITANVPSHGTAVFRVTAFAECVENITPTGMIFNTASLHCLTAAESSASWTNCTGSDAQVWQVGRNSSISSLADLSKCLSSNGGMTSCQWWQKDQKWGYAMTGNVLNSASGECLTEGEDGKVMTMTCAVENDAQVFELPSGSLQH
jgi:alpha-galactosidase